MEETRIEAEMQMLEERIGYRFCEISRLAEAMDSKLLPKQGGIHNKEYANDALACLGDTVIKLLITQYLYRPNKRKGEITEKKAALESNETFHRIAEGEHILDYAYNEKYFFKDSPPKHESVRFGKHDPYVEAIAAAIYLDGGWETVRRWFEEWLLPKLKQYGTP